MSSPSPAAPTPSFLPMARSQEEILIANFMESCPAKCVTSGVIGFGLGAVFGLFMSSFDYNQTESFLQASTRDQIRATFRDMKTRSISTAKGFGKVGAIFSGVECVIESYRAKTDIYNGILAGFLTGGIISVRSGPRVMLVSATGFSAFSAVIDRFTRFH